MALFFERDGDKDGLLSVRELEAVFDGLDMKDLGVDSIMDEAKAVTGDLDASLIGLEEFLGMLRAVHADEEDPDLMEAKIRRAFDQIDKNHDRELDKEEFKAAVALLGRSLTESQIDTLFNEIDVDASGKIDFPEFSSRLMNEWRGRPLS